MPKTYPWLPPKVHQRLFATDRLLANEMRIVKLPLALLACAGALLVFAGQDASSNKPAEATPKPAAVKASPALVKNPAADNRRCLVCHINFDEEELAVAHAKAGVGCVKCHGESNAHSSDEDNVTAPDTMFPKAKLNAACLKCHDKGKLSEIHKPVLAGTEPKNRYCTDCHGEHRLAHRTRNWDKETGKLLPIQKPPVKK